MIRAYAAILEVYGAAIAALWVGKLASDILLVLFFELPQKRIGRKRRIHADDVIERNGQAIGRDRVFGEEIRDEQDVRKFFDRVVRMLEMFDERIREKRRARTRICLCDKKDSPADEQYRAQKRKEHIQRRLRGLVLHVAFRISESHGSPKFLPPRLETMSRKKRPGFRRGRFFRMLPYGFGDRRRIKVYRICAKFAGEIGAR